MFMAYEPTELDMQIQERNMKTFMKAVIIDQLNLKSVNTVKLSLSHIYFQLLLVSESTDDLEPIYLPVSVPLFMRQQII